MIKYKAVVYFNDVEDLEKLEGVLDSEQASSMGFKYFDLLLNWEPVKYDKDAEMNS